MMTNLTYNFSGVPLGIMLLYPTFDALRTVQVKTLMEAAQLLGASEIDAFRLVIFPNLMKGFVVSVLLSFSLLFAEFIIANLMAGGHFETVQVYLFSQRDNSGHFTSAIVMSYFTFIPLTSFIVIKIESEEIAWIQA